MALQVYGASIYCMIRAAQHKLVFNFNKRVTVSMNALLGTFVSKNAHGNNMFKHIDIFLDIICCFSLILFVCLFGC